MAIYSTKQLEEISGIKAHTIRMWEKRYQLFSPTRSTTNIRNYCNNDLKRLLNISILLNNGYKISKIAKLKEEEINDKVLHSSNLSDDYNIQIKSLLVATIELDEIKFEKVLSKCIMQLGFENTFISVLYPLFYKIGLLWQTCKINTAQEHFLTHLVRQKLIVAIDSTLAKDHLYGLKFVLFLPENEYHELGLLFYHYIIKKHHHKVIYLGQSVPIDDVIEVVNSNAIDYIFTSVTGCNEKDRLDKFINNLVNKFPGKKIFLAGQPFSNIIPPFGNIQKITHPSMMKEILSQL